MVEYNRSHIQQDQPIQPMSDDPLSPPPASLRPAFRDRVRAETTRLVLDYGFTALGLHNVMLVVDSYNERGIRAYTRAGFKTIGRRREAHRLGGRPFDLILMDCLASEFQSPDLHQLLPGE